MVVVNVRRIVAAAAAARLGAAVASMLAAASIPALVTQERIVAVKPASATEMGATLAQNASTGTSQRCKISF